MKKLFKIFVIVLLLFSCMACKEEPQETETSFILPLDKLRAETTTEEFEYIWVKPEVEGLIPNTVGISIYEIYEDIEPEFVDKPDEDRGIKVFSNTTFTADDDATRLGVSKVLTLYTYSSNVSNMDPDVVTMFNELLVNKYGCDFVVSFYGGETGKDEDGYSYYHAVTDMRNMGKQADILFASTSEYYQRFVEAGFFVDITEYLSSTTYGKKLYDAYPEAVWDTVEINSKIYGYTPCSSPGRTYVVSCNKAIADRLGLDVAEGFSFYDIGDIFANADLSEENLGEIVPIYANWSNLYNMLGYYDLGRGILAKKDETGKWVAFNATEDEEFIKLCKTVKEYVDKGWLITDYTVQKKLVEGEFIFAVTSCEGADMGEDKLLYTYGSSSEVHEIIFGEVVHQYYDLISNGVYGITAWSEYKEEALKLITLINTEEDLVNLLIHGIENEHYTYSDKKVTKIPSQNGYGAEENMVNPNLLYSEYLEPDNKTEFYKMWSDNYEPDPFTEYGMSHYDYTKKEEAYDFDTVLFQLFYKGYFPLLIGNFEDVDEAISEVNRMQKEAGIDEFIAAINKMFKNEELQGRLVDE